MDTNDQMVKMRKDIKKAKGQVILKLLRKIKDLRKKKTSNDSQSLKNENRAKRFVEEVQLLKAVHPDTIFKQIIVTDWTTSDFDARSDVSLQFRAIMRVALVKFIDEKVKPIKQQIREYAEKHGESQINYVKISKELNKKDFENDLNNEKIFVNKNDEKDNKDENVNDEDIDDQSLLIDNKSLSLNEVDSEEENDEADNKEDDKKDTKEKNDDSKTKDNEIKKQLIDEEVILKSSAPEEKKLLENEKVLHKKDPPKISLNERVKDVATDDVSTILENIGQKFNDSESELSDEDLSEDNKADDTFFLGDAEPSTVNEKLPKKKFMNKSSEITSTFVSLSNCENKKDKVHKKSDRSQPFIKSNLKKKNRPGQRTRKLLAQGNPEFSKNKKNLKRVNSNKPGSSNSEKRTKDDSEENVHPSWHASQLKKQQCNIQKFEGKRTVFEDSD